MVFMSQGNESTLHSTAHYRPRFQDKVYCINVVLHFQQDPVIQIRPHINAVTTLADTAWMSPCLWDKYNPYIRQN